MIFEKRKSKNSIPIKSEIQEKKVLFFEAKNKIYQRFINGKLMNLRWAIVWVTQLIFLRIDLARVAQREMVF